MQDYKNDEAQSILEGLKEQAKKSVPEEYGKTQTTESSVSSDEDIKSMLKKHFSAGRQNSAFEMSEDYSFDTVDFGTVDDEIITGELPVEGTEPEDTEKQVPEEIAEETGEEFAEEIIENITEENTEEPAEEEASDVSPDAENPAGEEFEEEFVEQISAGIYPDENFVSESEGNDSIEPIVAQAVLENEEELDEIAQQIISEREERFDPEREEPEEPVFSEETEEETAEEPDFAEEIAEQPVEVADADEEPVFEEISEEKAEENAGEQTEYELTRVMGALDYEPEQEPYEPTRVIDAKSLSEPEKEEYGTGAPTYFYSQKEDGAESVKDMPEASVAPEVSDEDPISEESINYDEVLEGQQGTVFNNFVEDFTGDLDDVVFEAEITESHAPDKQYTIFEDWEQLMKDKDYATAEDGIIPPTKEELARSAEIRKASGNTDYFNTVGTAELDAVDIALMVALGGEDELNQTVGFEKIRQAVHDADEKEEKALKGKEIYGCSGDEYTSVSQNGKIRQKYKKDRTRLIIQTSLTAILTLVLILYEVTGWIGLRLDGIFNSDANPEIYVLAALQLLFICGAVSYNKFIKLFRNPFDFSSTAFIGAMIILLVNIPHDVLILAIGYADPGITFHSLSAFLMLIALIYDLFEISEQEGVFNIISTGEKKLVLEPYGKLRVSEESAGGEIIDKDSYCISRVPSLNKFFARISKTSPANSARLISLILSLSVSICVMLMLLLMGETLATIVLSFVITLSFTLVCCAVFETEFAFFVVHKSLKKYKTGIVGKASVSEYSKCNIVYFDDFNVFNKKSVRTKGLKLYDNNEIYRVLYHTQAVFSKVGGPLKGVFEFATTEMKHSKDVEIKEISKEGIGAVVDGRTSVLIGTGAYMKSHGIHPSYTPADVKAEESGEESIMFIALAGSLCAKLYVTYQFSSEFERLAKKLTARGVGIGIRSCDPNINDRWAKRYGNLKKMDISMVRPTLKEIKPSEKSIDGGVVSTKNVRALTEALMMCIRLDGFESLISKMRTVFVILTGILAFALVLLSGINTVSMLALTLEVAFCASLMMLLTHFYIKR
ncbi:MAG: hypothetical protein ACI3XL_02390 [Eubacteriales bacterium]